MTQTAERTVGLSTKRGSHVAVGDIVLVRLDEGIRRPLIVGRVGWVNVAPPMQPERLESRVSGILVCEPDDHTTPALRTLGQHSSDPARFHGRPDRLLPLCYGEYLKEGVGIGEWITKPTNLPSGS